MRSAPYLLFFVFGTAVGIYTLTLWPLFAFRGSTYPGLSHQQGIISLFLGSFIAGVLFTALPRFTRSSVSIYSWVQWVFWLSVIEWVGWLGNSALSAATMLAKFTILFMFVHYCSHRGKSKLPTTAWLYVSFLSVLIASAVNTWDTFASTALPTSITNLARALFAQGFLLAAVVGMGMRLLPAFAGLKVLRPNESACSPAAPSSPPYLYWHRFFAAVFLAGIFVEALFSVRAGMILVAVALGCEMIGFWRIYQKPDGHVRGRALWLSAWMLLLGAIAMAALPSWKIHLVHWPLIAGVVGITLVIGAQVLTAHEGLKADYMVRFNPLGWIWLLVVMTALTRTIAPLLTYESHLGYAGLTLAIALIWWLIAFPWQALKKRYRKAPLASVVPLQNGDCCPAAEQVKS